MTRPLIGVTTSEIRLAHRAEPMPEGDPPQREMALGMVYMRAVEFAGGIPVVLPPLGADLIAPLVDRLSGICLSGGPDLDPHGYGDGPDPHLGPTEPDLDAFELALAKVADQRRMPVLGICRGCQALNVARGGTLHQHIADFTDGTIEHRQAAPGRMPTHSVKIDPHYARQARRGVSETDVNSFHHQSAARLGKRLKAVAWSPDGVIEGIESSGPYLYLGVQWHAESLVELPEHIALFRSLVEEAGRYGAGDLTVRRAA